LEEQEDIFSDEGSIDFIALALRMVKYWYFFGLSLIIALTSSYFYTRYNASIYEASTTLMIQSDGVKSSSDRVLEGMDLFSKKKNIMNEKIILQSFPTILETIKKLDFKVSYFEYNGYVYTEMYNSSPFIVEFDTSSLQPINVYFEIESVNENEFIIRSAAESKNLYSFSSFSVENTGVSFSLKQRRHYDDRIKSDNFNFKIRKNIFSNGGFYPGFKYFFTFNDINQLALRYKSAVQVNELQKGVDVLVITLRDNNVNKITDFLNELTSVYITRDLDRKNSMANNTIKFIDNQLVNISDSLFFAENRLQDFRSSNKIMDMDFQSQQLFTKLAEHQTEKAVLISKKEYYQYLINSINGMVSIEDLMVPSTIGINDPTLNKLVSDLLDLNTQRLALKSNAMEKSPSVINIERKIADIKKLILQNLANIVEVNNLSLQDVNSKLDKLEEEARKLPQKQQKLFGFEREFKLNDAIYTFLLQKRAEAQIAKASNLPDCEVIDAARNDVFTKKSTKYTQIYLVGLLIGLLVPGILIYVDFSLKNHILIRKDIERITKIPIVGGIIQYHKPVVKVFVENPKSTIAESFRSFYTNLQYFIKGKAQQVVLVTSSMPKEGKTFNSINLASVYASFGKKTCLLSFDLRLAKVHKAFDISGEIGISNYLINYCTLDDIIFTSGIQNLDIIPAGPVPPNPVELIASSRTEELFATLKQRYECIIIDSPPVGVVADALLLARFSDVSVIVVRQNYTRKKVLTQVIKELAANDINKTAILFNGIKETGIYGYAYGYGYGYGYGYYKDEKEKWWRKIWNKGQKWRKVRHSNGT